jgi:hypothetical protein
VGVVPVRYLLAFLWSCTVLWAFVGMLMLVAVGEFLPALLAGAAVYVLALFIERLLNAD